MIPIFITSWENPKMNILCKFGDPSSNPLQVTARRSQISWNSETKWPWRSRPKTLISNTSLEYPRMAGNAILMIPAQICDELLCRQYLIISWYLHVWNGVAVAAYSRLASRSQAKFHTKKLSPLVRPCAAAPAQSTTSAYRSLDFRQATSSQRGRWVGSWPLLLRSIHEDTN